MEREKLPIINTNTFRLICVLCVRKKFSVVFCTTVKTSFFDTFYMKINKNEKKQIAHTIKQINARTKVLSSLFCMALHLQQIQTKQNKSEENPFIKRLNRRCTSCALQTMNII